MGSVRGRLVLWGAVCPSTALADVCDKMRPSWDGTPATLSDEAAILFFEPLSLVAVAASAITVWFRSKIGSIGVFARWVWIAVWALASSTLHDDLWEAISEEGCRSSPDLFIGLSAAICIATLYLVWRPRKARTSGD